VAVWEISDWQRACGRQAGSYPETGLESAKPTSGPPASPSFNFRIARDSGGGSKFTQNPGPAEKGPTDDTAVPKTSQGDSVMTVVTSAGSPF